MKLSSKRFLIISIIPVLFFGMQSSVAHAAQGDAIELYISAPLVQGSDVTGAGSDTENFNSFSATSSGDFCPTTIAVGTLTPSVSGTSACILKTVQTYGGASSTSSSPVAGGTGSIFPATPYPANSNSITIDFPSPVKYVGLWWSAGNAGNTVEFLRSGQVIASLQTQALADLLGATRPNPWPSANGSVRAIGGDEYPKGHYFGNPRGFSVSPPAGQSTVDPTVQFLYLNLYLAG